MDLSVFLARFFGLYLIIVGVICLIRKVHIQKIVSDFYNDRPLVFYSGVISLIVGLLIVLSHNIWTADWRVLITILGYLALVKGIMRLSVDSFKEKPWIQRVTRKNGLIYFGIAYILVGLCLAYNGFFNYPAWA